LTEDKGIVIIGCGAGGGTTAQFARKTNRKTMITIFEKENYAQYSKCGLPYVISGDIPKIDDLVEFDASWFKKSKIDISLNSKVEKIDKKNNLVYVKKGNETIKKPYHSLIISTGAKPSTPKIKNVESDGVLVIRTIDDVKKLKKRIKRNKKVVILGAGLIGLEMADSLFNLGMKVSIVEYLPSILPNVLDSDMTKILLAGIPKDINIYTNSLATEIVNKDGKISNVLIKNRETGQENVLDADLMITSTGAIPDVELAEKVGCRIGKTGRIIINNKCETSIKDIYAVGDCTEYIDFITAKPCPVGLGSITVRQGMAAGINAAGGNYELLKGLLNTSTSKFFEIEIASVGPITNKLGDFTTVSSRFNGSSLPDYFPGGKPVTIKVTVDKFTGIIMNAQCIGDKAAQRINTIASAIIGELDIETFRKLETAYAPPIAPTLDVVTLVCDIISKKIKHK